MWNVPVTVTSQLSPVFVSKSMFRARHIVHPGGGGATRLVCESCQAEYPYVANPVPCSNCAVMKQSGVMIAIAHRTREWLWSDWGWCVKHNDRYVADPNPNPDLKAYPTLVVTKFTSKHKALDKAAELESAEWRRHPDGYVDAYGADYGYYVSVDPYPLKPIVAVPVPDAIMSGVMSSTPGIGAKRGIFGTKRERLP